MCTYCLKDRVGQRPKSEGIIHTMQLDNLKRLLYNIQHVGRMIFWSIDHESFSAKCGIVSAIMQQRACPLCWFTELDEYIF